MTTKAPDAMKPSKRVEDDDSPPDVCAECGEPLNGSGNIWCDNCKCGLADAEDEK